MQGVHPEVHLREAEEYPHSTPHLGSLWDAYIRKPGRLYQKGA